MSHFTRRQTLAMAGSFALAPLRAQTSQLPLKTTGLEHVGLTVPDAQKSAKFYGLIFDPQLFQERDPPPRYYVKLGTAYAAFGQNATAAPRIDHYCALVQDYRVPEMRKELEAIGVPLTGQAAFGYATDPDGHRLQMLATPGGLARTIIPSTRVSQDDAAVHVIGLDHIMLTVTDLDKAAAHYRKLFGPEVSRGKNPDRVWFGAAKTRLGLEKVAAGKTPLIEHFSLRVAGFDRRVVTDRLKKLGVEVVASNDENLLRFRDNDGILVELKAGS